MTTKRDEMAEVEVERVRKVADGQIAGGYGMVAASGIELDDVREAFKSGYDAGLLEADAYKLAWDRSREKAIEEVLEVISHHYLSAGSAELIIKIKSLKGAK